MRRKAKRIEIQRRSESRVRRWAKRGECVKRSFERETTMSENHFIKKRKGGEGSTSPGRWKVGGTNEGLVEKPGGMGSGRQTGVTIILSK